MQTVSPLPPTASQEEHRASPTFVIKTSLLQKIQKAVVNHLVKKNDNAPASLQINRSCLQPTSFETVTRYLPNVQQLLASHNRDKEVIQLCNDLQINRWKQILARYRNEKSDHLANDALKALRDSKIAIEQFCTLSYAYTLLKEFPDSAIHVHSLFSAQGKIDQAAKKILSKSLYKPSAKNFFTDREASAVAKRFFENMQRKLPSERLFFYIKHPITRYEKRTIRDALEDHLGFRVFSNFLLDGERFRMVPSFSMIQACVDAYGEENTLAPTPTIRLSTRADLRRNIDERGREIFTPFPQQPCPTSADGLPIGNTSDFLFHDIYHCMVCSQVPDYIRKEVGWIADIVCSLQQQLKEDTDAFTLPFLDTFYGRLVDMEFSLFREQSRKENGPLLNSLSKEEILLITLELQLFRNTQICMRLKLRDLMPKNQRSILSATAVANLERWDALKERVCGRLAENPHIKFSNLFQEFCDTGGVCNQLAHLLCKKGFFNRLQLSNKNIERAQRANPFSLPAPSFMDRLMACQTQIKKEENAQL